MGFNSRYIDEKMIRSLLKEEGLEYLIQYVKKPDTLIIEDEFSEKICDIIRDNENKTFMGLAEMGLYGKKEG